MAETYEDIFAIVRAGDGDTLAAVLAEEPALATSVNAEGASLLSYAVYAGQRDLAQIVRKHRDTITPFEAVALRGEMAVLRQALKDGWTPDDLSPDGFTGLALACFFDNEQAVELLLPDAVNLNRQAENAQRVAAIHAAVSARNPRTVESLLRAGADPNLPQQGGYRPLHTAAQHGDVAICGMLILFGADPTLGTDAGRKAPDFARMGGHDWLAERLNALGSGA